MHTQKQLELALKQSYSQRGCQCRLNKGGRILFRRTRYQEGSLKLEERKRGPAVWVADGTKAKIKCVMSALFSHAVRWEFCGHNPISSGMPVGGGGKRGPSTGVRVSAKRQRAPLVLLAEQVKLGLGN